MSDEPKRISILTPDGKFDTIGAEFADEVVRAGGRVLTKSEAEKESKKAAQAAAQKAVDERYEKLPSAQKFAGAVRSIGDAITPGGAAGMAVSGLGLTPGAPPTVDAFNEGLTSGLTGGLAHGLTRKAVEAVSGKDAGDQYAAQISASKTASPWAHGAGELVGTGVGLVSSAGATAERLAAKVLARAGVQGTSALARAGVAATKLGVRGAAEGAAIKGGEYLGDAMLQDHEASTDKLFAALGTGALYGGATGAVLGGGGSLAGSGISRLFGRAAAREGADIAVREVSEEAAPKLAADASVDDAIAMRKSLDSVGAPAVTGGPAKGLIGDLSSESGIKARAYDRAWSAIGGGFGLQSTEPAARAQKYLTNGTRDIGEVLMRKGILNPQAGVLEAAAQGTPASMLPKIDAELETVGRRIGELTDASGGRIDTRDVYGAIQDVARKYGESAATRPAAREIERFGRELVNSLGADNAVTANVAVQDLLRERKAIDHIVFDNAALNTTNLGTQVKRELRGKLEDLIVTALDESSGRTTGELATEYKALKKDYIALSIASDVASDSATRAAKASFLGLSSLTAGGGSIVKSLAHKVVKEHGDAVAATLLYQAAEKGTLARWIGKVDNQIGRASKGLLAAPEKGAAKASEVMPPPRQLATKALARVAAFQADPDAFVDHATQQTESMATHSPEIASALVARQVQAMTFLASKVPYQGESDPLDPHPKIRMTPSEEASFARYAWYTEKPDRFFAEVSRGKLTPEGAEVAQALMPRAFEQLQQETFDALTTQLARGNKIPFRQRELLGQLLDFAATPAQRPEHRTFLQQNVADVLPSKEPSLAAPAKMRRASTTPSGSALDRLEAGGPGHR